MTLLQALVSGEMHQLSIEWQIVERRADGIAMRNRKRGLYCIVSAAYESDGKLWGHLSLSHVDRLPSWTELTDAKEQFFGNVEAYQVMPPRARYVNLHPHVLHLFTCIQRPNGVLPHFDADGKTL